MKLQIKSGVAFDVDSFALGRLLAGLLLMPTPDGWAHGDTLTVTSGSDGAHAANSRHYRGEALDLRTRGWSPSDRAVMVVQVEAMLGQKFRCLDEVDHLHVQVRKGVAYP